MTVTVDGTQNHSLVGDLSAILIQNVNPLINFVRVPSKKIALMSEWETKIEADKHIGGNFGLSV